VKATIIQNLEANLSAEQLEASGKAVAQLLTISDSLDPYKPQLHYRIGSFWLALGDRQSAKKSLAVALTDSFNYSRPVFDLLWSSVEDVRELSSLVGSAPLARALLGNFLWMRGYRPESEEQFKHLEGLKEMDYQSGEALIAHCIRERQFGRARSIVSKLQTTRAFRPAFNQARLEYFRGRTYLQEAQYQRAIESFEKSMRLDPANIQSHLDLAEAYLSEGQAEKAIARWRYVLSRWPKLPEGIAIPGQVHFGLGRAYEAVGDAQRALAEYLQASSEDPGNASFSRKASEITKGL
jgi:tetratricopeptide (TPR) repeat protein